MSTTITDCNPYTISVVASVDYNGFRIELSDSYSFPGCCEEDEDNCPGVESISCVFDGQSVISETSSPTVNETIFISSKDVGETITLTAKPGSGTWPAGKPNWTNALAEGSPGTATVEADAVLDDPDGEIIVEAECDDNVKKIRLLKMDVTAEDTEGNTVAANPSGSFSPPVDPTIVEIIIPVPGTISNDEFSSDMLYNSALVVYYDDVIEEVNGEWQLRDFDIKLNLPDGLGNVTWALESGPENSGKLIDADQPKAIFRNPTKGGLYKFSCHIGSFNFGTFQVLLPVSGPDISPYMQRQIDYLKKTWGPQFRANLNSYFGDFTGRTMTAALMKNAMALGAIRYIGNSMDYDVPLSGPIYGEKTPSSGPNGGTELGLADIHRYAIHDQIMVWNERNNMMYALLGREMGIPEYIVKYGPNLSQNKYVAYFVGMGAVGMKDDEYTFEAYEAGFDLHDGVTLESVIDDRARNILRPGSWAEREWPSYEITTDGLDLQDTAEDKLNNLLGDDLSNLTNQ